MGTCASSPKVEALGEGVYLNEGCEKGRLFCGAGIDGEQ